VTPAEALAEHAHEAAETLARQRRRVAEVEALARHYAERGYDERLRLREMEDEAGDARAATRAARRAERTTRGRS
jgi:3-methyladenine DNA glycosylase/8-oxoguanine DNA glycosylase